MGPSNSGKSTKALQFLSNAKRGCYISPMPNLNLNDLDEHNFEIQDLENIDLSKQYDCVVIDKIQLINDKYKGNYLTQALLGLQATEVHLCGDEDTYPIITSVLSHTKDSLTLNKYQRNSKLEVTTGTYKAWDHILPGDCIVDFSSKRIHEIKNQINMEFNRDPEGKGDDKDDQYCAILYKDMPKEVMYKQMLMFNQRKV